MWLLGRGSHGRTAAPWTRWRLVGMVGRLRRVMGVAGWCCGMWLLGGRSPPGVMVTRCGVWRSVGMVGPWCRVMTMAGWCCGMWLRGQDDLE